MPLIHIGPVHRCLTHSQGKSKGFSRKNAVTFRLLPGGKLEGADGVVRDEITEEDLKSMPVDEEVEYEEFSDEMEEVVDDDDDDEEEIVEEEENEEEEAKPVAKGQSSRRKAQDYDSEDPTDYGFPDDGYDYMKHLMPIGGVKGGIFIPAASTKPKADDVKVKVKDGANAEEEEEEEEEETERVSGCTGHTHVICWHVHRNNTPYRARITRCESSTHHKRACACA